MLLELRFKPGRSAAWLLVLTAALIVGLGSSTETLEPDAVNTTRQMLVDAQSRTYTLVAPGSKCSTVDKDTTYQAQFCCDDGTTKACRNGTTMFCIRTRGEVQPPKGPYPVYVKSARLIDVTGVIHVRDECVFRGTGPTSKCSVDNLNKAEIQCCKGRNSEQCLVWNDNAPCPMSHPAAFCRVCTINKITPLEIATLVLAAAAALGTVVSAGSTLWECCWKRRHHVSELLLQKKKGKAGVNQGGGSESGQAGQLASCPSGSPVLIKLHGASQSGAATNPECQALLVTLSSVTSSSSSSSSSSGSAPGSSSSGDFSAAVGGAHSLEMARP